MVQAFAVPRVLPEAREEAPFPPDFRLDIERGDLVLGAYGDIERTADGYEAWRQWCLLALRVERYGNDAFTEFYGTERARIIRAPNPEIAQAEAERVITEALAADPYGRTFQITNWRFERLGLDQLHVSFTVTPVAGRRPSRMEVDTSG